MQLGGLVPVLVLGVPQGIRLRKLKVSLKFPPLIKEKHLLDEVSHLIYFFSWFILFVKQKILLVSFLSG